MKTPTALEDLIESLRCLPGVGPRSAQRMAYYLLQHDHVGAHQLANALDKALANIKHCEKCNSFTETSVCALCCSTRRNASLLCVVEMPADLLMIEQAHCYKGNEEYCNLDNLKCNLLHLSQVPHINLDLLRII